MAQVRAGRGTVREHRGGLELSAYAGVSPATGNPQRLTERLPLDTPAKTVERRLTALQARADELAEARRHRRKEGGHVPVPTAPGKKVERTCGQAFDLWWKAHARHLARAATHRTNLDCHLIPAMGDVALWRLRDTIDEEEAGRDPDLFDVSAFYERLRREGAAGRMGKDGPRTGKGGPVGDATVESVHATLRAALNYVARKDGWLPNGSPLAGMKGVRSTVVGDDTVPLPEEMAALVPWLIGDRLDLAVAALLVGNGPRPTEVAAVRWMMLDLDTGRLDLRGEGIVKVSGRGERERWELRSDPTDKRRARPIQLEPLLVGLLRRRWAEQRALALACGVPFSRRAFVLSEASDGMAFMTPHSLGTAFTRALERARSGDGRRQGERTDLGKKGIRKTAGLAVPEGMTLYDMRHYGITHALRARVGIAEVARRFGTSKRMINERYDHAVPGEDEMAAAAMGTVWAAGLAVGERAEVVPIRP